MYSTPTQTHTNNKNTNTQKSNTQTQPENFHVAVNKILEKFKEIILS